MVQSSSLVNLSSSMSMPQLTHSYSKAYNHVKQWFDLEDSKDDSPDRSSPILNARNGDIESDPDERVVCDENSFDSLFTYNC